MYTFVIKHTATGIVLASREFDRVIRRGSVFFGTMSDNPEIWYDDVTKELLANKYGLTERIIDAMMSDGVIKNPYHIEIL